MDQLGINYSSRYKDPDEGYFYWKNKNMGKRYLLLGLFLLAGAHISHYDSIAKAPKDQGEAPFEKQLGKDSYTVLETHEVWATAYTSAPEETDDTPFTTASGSRTRDGVLATNFLPFGTKVRIPEYDPDKVFTVEDRMHPRKVGFVDLWMETKQDAFNFGKRRIMIEVIADDTEEEA